MILKKKNFSQFTTECVRSRRGPKSSKVRTLLVHLKYGISRLRMIYMKNGYNKPCSPHLALLVYPHFKIGELSQWRNNCCLPDVSIIIWKTKFIELLHILRTSLGHYCINI